MRHSAHPRGFDVQALFGALDERRDREGLSWAQVASAMWQLSADLNAGSERSPHRTRGQLGTDGAAPALHAEPAHRAADRQVRHEYAAGHAHLPGTPPPGG